MGGEQDGSGAGAEGRGLADEDGEGIEEAVALQVTEEGGGFASGNDQTLQTGKLFGAADEDRFSTELDERLSVFRVGALQSENTDFKTRDHLLYGTRAHTRHSSLHLPYLCKVFQTGALGPDLDPAHESFVRGQS